MSSEMQQWIGAGTVLGKDPTAKVTCPKCQLAALQVKDAYCRNTLERHLFCPRCGARNSILIRLDSQPNED